MVDWSIDFYVEAKTEEDAKAICSALRGLGYDWKGGQSLEQTEYHGGIMLYHVWPDDLRVTRSVRKMYGCPVYKVDEFLASVYGDGNVDTYEDISIDQLI